MEDSISITERAMKRFPTDCDEEFDREVLGPRRNWYILAAREQREIDIERALDIHCDICLDRRVHQSCKIPCPDKERFRKAMLE